MSVLESVFSQFALILTGLGIGLFVVGFGFVPFLLIGGVLKITKMVFAALENN